MTDHMTVPTDQLSSVPGMRDIPTGGDSRPLMEETCKSLGVSEIQAEW